MTEADDQQLIRTVQNLLRPRQPATTGYLRCADLYCGDGEMADAAVKVGLDIAYAYDLDATIADAYTEKFGIGPFSGNTDYSISSAPNFHVLLMRLHSNALNVPEQPKRAKLRKLEMPVEHAMRFLYVRRPVGFLFVGRNLPDGFTWDVLNVIQEEALRWGYAFECKEENGISAIAGVAHSMGPFPWPKPLTLDATVKAVRQAALVPGLRADRV